MQSRDRLYNNAGATSKQGLELSGELALGYGFSLGGNYTYSHFRFDHFLEPISGVLYDRSGKQLPYVPENQYTAYVAYRGSKGFRARLEFNTWGRYWVDNANTVTYKGYSFITNLSAGYQWKQWSFDTNVGNLFDKKYAMEVTSDTAGLHYRPASPLSYYGRVTYNF